MEDKSKSVSRRGFIVSLMAFFASVAGILGIFIAGGFLYPVARKNPEPLFICMTDEIPDSEPLVILDPAGRKVFLMRKPDGSLMAMSTVCTHLGCNVYYRKGKEIFECPCHQGVFDIEGNPVSGPPQIPLERYPVGIRNKMVFVYFG